MAINFLRLNSNKTERLIIDLATSKYKTFTCLEGSTNLSNWTDSATKLLRWMKKTTLKGFAGIFVNYQLCLLCKVRYKYEIRTSLDKITNIYYVFF